VNYRAPGVYVQEVPSGARMIGRVGTSSAGFVGVAPDPTARVDEVVAIDNWTQFVDIFVGDATEGTALSNAVYGFISNGGSRCYVVNVGPGGSLAGTARKPSGLRLLEGIDEIAIIAAPGYADPESYEALLSHCEDPLRQDRVAILDTVENVQNIDSLLEVATTDTPAGPAPAGQPPGTAPASGSGTAFAAPLRPRQSNFGTLYFPWVIVTDPVSGQRVSTPPSGHMAGIWARTDATRGVHKAPANEPALGVSGLVHRVSRGEQELLNPAGVNCIRYFPGEGIRVWGARTLAAEASEWRYLNVRRLVNMIKESIADGTRWIVFEPNDYTLWRSIRRDIGAFLTNVWRDGALLGRTPQEAFFVKCDEETNPPDVRDAGQVVTIIGLAPVKPAEFVIFKLMQSADITQIETAGG
jgi:phage tail sheath protein FI